MGKETELKFEVAPQDLVKLRTAPALRRKPQKEEDLLSVYFDTPKQDLARNNVTLRVDITAINSFKLLNQQDRPSKEANGSMKLRVNFPIFVKRAIPLLPPW